MGEGRNSLPLSVNEPRPIVYRIIMSIAYFVVLFLVITFLLHKIYPWEVTGYSIAELVVIIGVPIINFFFSRVKYKLSETGVIYRYSLFQQRTYPWDSFQSYTVVHSKKRFKLKRKGIGSVDLYSAKKFDEIEQIIKERIPILAVNNAPSK